jgi:hypothetical protein
MLNDAERKLYSFWFSNEMSQNRKSALDTLASSCNVDFVLVDSKTFYDYENLEIPVHPAFKYLSDVHKSAYARPYFMYFYGGGYSDIKANSFDWNPYFDQLLTSRQDAIGYSEKSLSGVAKFWQPPTPTDISENFFKFAGNGHYIFKPRSDFAKEWLVRLHKALDEKLETLANNPGTYHPYAVTGGILNSHTDYPTFVAPTLEYPITWNEINGRIKHKIEYENGFSDFILSMPFTNIKNYR